MDSDGMYVELDNMVEGKIKRKELKGDYIYNEDSLSFLSIEGNEDYYLGDRLNLEVCYASKERKEINFRIKEKITENERINKNTNEYVKQLKIEEKYLKRYYNID